VETGVFLKGGFGYLFIFPESAELNKKIKASFGRLPLFT
jgi:hypothetical protein